MDSGEEPSLPVVTRITSIRDGMHDPKKTSLKTSMRAYRSWPTNGKSWRGDAAVDYRDKREFWLKVPTLKLVIIL
jgi:hypothetical protein